MDIEFPRPHVAIAAIRAFDGADATDLFPDPDWPLLAAALVEAGAEARAVSWDHEDVDWHRFALVVLNSTWNSVDQPEQFLGWARRVAKSTTMLNPIPAIEWNIDKTYLRSLQSRGVPIVETEWVSDADTWEPPSHEFVVKPSISAGGRETARYRPDEGPAAAVHVCRLLDGGQTVMVQPYVASVEGVGEAKLVFIDGEFSHAVRVGPLLARDAGVVERPWERPVAIEALEPDVAQLGAAHDVLAAVHAEIGQPLLYARVDLLASPSGAQVLGEVELIDPSLFLRFVPAAARRYANAITAHAARALDRA